MRQWRPILVTVTGYAVTLAVLNRAVAQTGTGTLHWSPYAVLNFTCALMLVISTVWLVSLRHSLRTELTIALTVCMGLLADLLTLQGLTLLHGASRHAGTALVLGALCAASLIVLTVRGNVASRLGQRYLQQMQETDVLTGLANRRGVLREYLALQGPHREVTVALLDVNDLRRLNEKEGHNAGDAYLQAIAGLLRDLLPSDAVLGRWGGDEFVVLVPRAVSVAPLLADPRLRALQAGPDPPTAHRDG